MIHTDTIQQEIEQEKQLGRIDDTSRETNPYKELIFNNTENGATNDTNRTVVNFEQYSKLYTTQEIQFHEPYARC